MQQLNKRPTGKVSLTVNDKGLECAGDITLLQAIQLAGIDLPALCQDPRLKPCGSCRMCLVDLEGSNRPVAACLTRATEGMIVHTNTPELERARKVMLALLAAKYPDSAVTRWPEKPFHRWLRHYGLACKGPEASDIDDSHPYIRVQMSRCIKCYRCVRICAEVQGQFVWSIRNRGEDTEIVADSEGPFAQSSCVSCGACVDTCPTGALEDKHVLTHTRSQSWTRTTCPYCGTGCEMEVGVAGGYLVSVRPAMDAPVSHGHLCVKGRYAFGFVHADDRITHPMVRRSGQWEPVSWRMRLGT